MNKNEFQQTNEQLLNIYCGILFHAAEFQEGQDVSFSYWFDCPEFSELREKYPIEKIAGKGGDFQRALRLCRWLAPRLKHKGDYDNHVPCNSLALLDYCFEKEDVGINCVNKAKILAECCLALGIYARRLLMYPLSPYDMDNHVVTEIFDRGLSKWILLDPTAGSYFTDGEHPLSALEARALFAQRGRVSVVLNRQNPKNVDGLSQKLYNLYYNAYYAKNFYRLSVEAVSEFGDAHRPPVSERYPNWDLLPKGFDGRRWSLQNGSFRIDGARRFGYEEGLLKELEQRLDRDMENYRVQAGTVKMWDPPTA